MCWQGKDKLPTIHDVTSPSDNGIVDEHFDKHHNFFSENGMQSSIKEAG